MPLFVVDCISVHRMRYVVEAKELEHAYDEVTMKESGKDEDFFDELSQRWHGETIVDGREVTRVEFESLVENMKNDKNEMCNHWMVEESIRKVKYEDSSGK